MNYLNQAVKVIQKIYICRKLYSEKKIVKMNQLFVEFLKALAEFLSDLLR